ncbi:MAG: DUF4270 family protein [Saprospiraceae bacterium]
MKKKNNIPMRPLNWQIWIFLIIVLSVSSCQDPILVGGDFLENEKLVIGSTGTTKLSTITIAGDSVGTHHPKIDSKTYLLGELDDLVFGKVNAELYLKFLMKATKPNYQNETNLRFDSLVLVMQYDTTGTYGNTRAVQDINIYQLDEVISSTDTFYSNQKFSNLPTPIGQKTVLVSPKDSVKIVDHLTGKNVTLAPQLRIRLNDDFGKSLIQNGQASTNDTVFGDFLKGIYITSKSTNNQPFMYGVNLSDNAIYGTINKLAMYYTVKDTVEKVYEYYIAPTTIGRYTHDRKASIVESFISTQSLGDSLTFIQGLGGAKSVVKFSNLDKLDSVIINKAELEFYVASEPSSLGYYPVPPQIIATRKNDAGNFVFIDDNAYNISALYAFGGQPITSGTVTKYTMNITNHIIKAIKTSGFDADIYLNVMTESENVKRVVLYGAKHSTYPLKLNILYTKK